MNRDDKLDLDAISALVPLARDGDHNAQNQILEQVQDVLIRMARQQFQSDLRQRQNPSDIVQLTLTRMVNGFDDFRGTSEKELFAWLKTILRNEIHVARRFQNQAKRDARRDQIPTDSSRGIKLSDGVDPELTPGSEALKNEKLEILSRAMERLPTDFAMVIQMRSLEEKPFQEIADSMNRSYNSVAKLWQRAVIQLEKELDDMEMDER